jgi:hypothetical protein
MAFGNDWKGEVDDSLYALALDLAAAFLEAGTRAQYDDLVGSASLDERE